MNYAAWIAELKSKFEQAEEFALASEIYSFSSAFKDGMSPQAAYADFDKWVSFFSEV